MRCAALAVGLVLLLPALLCAAEAVDLYDSGATGDVNRQINRMWSMYGRAEGVRLTPFGNSPAWFEWMALKHTWSDTPELRKRLHQFLVHWPQSRDGYMWTWGTEEGWPTHHVRHNENNGKYILAVHRFCCWQGGKDFLEERDTTTKASTQPGQSDVSEGRTVLEKTRAAMEYQLNSLQGRSGLAIISDPKCDGTVDGMPSDYWDNFRFGYKSAYVNIYFYASLQAMAELEASLGNTERSTELTELAAKVRVEFSRAFWDDTNGRFIGCVDRTGRRWDLGFTYLNLEAIAYGLASQTQAQKVFEWLDGKRIIESDKQRIGNWMTGATGEEIYSLRWAPRSTTRAVESIAVDGKYWWWHLGNKINVGERTSNAAYGEHLENGGAIFYVSHYDLISRLRVLGADKAWERFEAILSEFREDQLQRDPKNHRGAPWKWGIIGEFPESGLVPATIALGFMGLSATPDALVIEPRLPKALPWLEVKHVAYRGGIYNVRADARTLQITTVEGSAVAASVRYDSHAPRALPPAGRQLIVQRTEKSQ